MSKSANSTPAALAARVAAGDRAAAARALSCVVNEDAGFEALSRALFSAAGRSHKVGVCGPPGSGKSTLISALIKALRAEGKRVGALVVDPTSPFSGGAFLGDRLRIQSHALDPEVFIRSLASRGMVGGVSATIFAAAHVLEAWGADVLLIETVGIGQDEVEIARVADTVVYVTAPSLGDEIQAMKAGTMEVADLFVVNKSDLPETARAVADIRRALSLSEKARKVFEPRVVAISALQETGLPQLMAELAAHREHLKASGEGAERFTAQLREELSLFVGRRLYRDVLSRLSARDLAALAAKKTDPVTLGKKILAGR